MHWRIANEVARIEAKYKNGLNAQQLYELLDHFKYIVPQGSPMTGIGNDFQVASLSNCFVIGILGAPDMRLPIQYALTYPNRLPMKNNELDFTKYPSLTFDEPDTDTFYALKLAYDALKDGGIKPTVFNSADEAAVELFMQGKISYLGISDAIAKAMSEIKNIENPTISDIWETDKLAREIVYRLEKESLI